MFDDERVEVHGNLDTVAGPAVPTPRVARALQGCLAGDGMVREVDVVSVQGELHRYRVIDVREPEEIEEVGRIVGAENVPLSRLASVAERWRREQPILLVCRSGARSARGGAELVRLGFVDVANLTGGMVAWTARALPVVR